VNYRHTVRKFSFRWTGQAFEVAYTDFPSLTAPARGLIPSPPLRVHLLETAGRKLKG
jgi:hypothetical protein